MLHNRDARHYPGISTHSSRMSHEFDSSQEAQIWLCVSWRDGGVAMGRRCRHGLLFTLKGHLLRPVFTSGHDALPGPLRTRTCGMYGDTVTLFHHDTLKLFDTLKFGAAFLQIHFQKKSDGRAVER